MNPFQPPVMEMVAAEILRCPILTDVIESEKQGPNVLQSCGISSRNGA